MPSGVEKLIQKCSPLHIHDSSWANQFTLTIPGQLLCSNVIQAIKFLNNGKSSKSCTSNGRKECVSNCKWVPSDALHFT
jgi:hypothetical protein